MKRRTRTAATIWIVVTVVLVTALAAATARVGLALLPYPELDAFLGRPRALRVLDRSGGLLKVVGGPDGLRNEFVPLSAIPKAVVTVFLRSEDRRFYFHPGVDPLAVVRSAYLNAAEGRVVSGASTLSMQLARLVSPARRGHKLAEAWDALRLEARLGKRRVLELYLNSIPFANNVEGVASAARYFFSRSLAELETEEICILAVMPRRPALYNPFNDPDAAGRAAHRFARNSGLDAALFRSLSEDNFIRAAAAARRGSEPNGAPHFVRAFIEPSDARVSAAETGEFRTSIDPRIQEALLDAIRKRVGQYERFRMTNGAGLVLDNATGEILAYVGSRDFYNEHDRGQIDGVRVTNQPGSCLKPFLYALALENGFSPSTVLPDVPSDFGGEAVYVPMNFNRRFNGPVRLRVALASSLNVPAVYTLNRLGVRNFVDFLKRFGFDSLAGVEGSLGVGLALGNAEVSLLELTRAFSVFPRGGLSLEVSPFVGGTHPPVGAKGGADARSGTKGRLVSPYTAAVICDILSDNPSRFVGFANGRAMNTPYAAMFKTGTANQFQHVWALGATPEYTVGIWMGNFTGETIIGRTGSGIPATAVVDVLDKIARRDSVFPPPPDSVRTEVCALSGGKPGPACVGTVHEYLPTGTELAPCSYHVLDGGRRLVRYPDEYAVWLARRGRERSDLAPPERSGGPVILQPADGAEFFFDPSIPDEDQAIAVVVAGLAGGSGPAAGSASGRAAFTVNGEEGGRVPDSGTVYFHLRAGTFRFAVTVAGQERAAVTFRVR